MVPVDGEDWDGDIVVWVFIVDSWEPREAEGGREGGRGMEGGREGVVN